VEQIPNFPDYHGPRLPISEMARVDRLASRDHEVTGGESFSESGAAGGLALPARAEFWGEVKGPVPSSYPYHYEISYAVEDNYTHTSDPDVEGLTAWEVNQNTAVPAGSVVRVSPSEGGRGERWKFAYEAGAGGGIDNVSGEAPLNAHFSVTGQDVWQNVGLSVALPSQGTYLLHANVTCFLKVTWPVTGNADGAEVQLRLFDATAGAQVGRIVTAGKVLDDLGAAMAIHTTGFTFVVTVAGARTVQLQARRDVSAAAAAVFTDIAYADGDGNTTLSYVKLTN
jgi:hypothetical protein